MSTKGKTKIYGATLGEFRFSLKFSIFGLRSSTCWSAKVEIEEIQHGRSISDMLGQHPCFRRDRALYEYKCKGSISHTFRVSLWLLGLRHQFILSFFHDCCRVLKINQDPIPGGRAQVIVDTG
jgi:hypothetical protein